MTALTSASSLIVGSTGLSMMLFLRTPSSAFSAYSLLEFPSSSSVLRLFDLSVDDGPFKGVLNALFAGTLSITLLAPAFYQASSVMFRDSGSGSEIGEATELPVTTFVAASTIPSQ